MIYSPILAAVSASFGTTVASLLLLRPLALRTDFVDRPGGRKRHIGNVPIVGGIGMFAGIIAGVVALGVADELTIGFFFAVLMLVLVGAFDDIRHVPPIIRVLVQAAAVAVMAFSSGMMLFSLGNPFGFGEIALGPFALLGTLLVALTVINAYNLVDGADGLAGTLGLIALVAVAVVGHIAATPTFLALVVGGALAGFLMFNFPTTLNRSLRTFMGDSGSTVLGFTVFWGTLGISQGEHAAISPVVGLWFASIPVYDCLTCFVRRILKKKSPFSPGRDHFHHVLFRGGFTARRQLAILGGLQAIYAAIGVGASLLGVAEVVLFTVWSLLGLTQRFVITKVAALHRLHVSAQQSHCCI